jgi:hypothetical protein
MWIEKPFVKPIQGSIVRIKSGGGPVMSVGCRIGDAHWLTWWDESTKSFKTEMLYLSQVVVVEYVKD